MLGQSENSKIFLIKDIFSTICNYSTYDKCISIKD